MTYSLGRGTGPLKGLRVIELAGIGPGPHAATILADLGADVLRVDRPGGGFTAGPAESDFLTRGRPNVALDLKQPDAIATVLELVERADVLIEGMRPGVAERLGVGPEACFERNAALIYGRMTGWGQDGPWAAMAGHDINYTAITGALHASGQDPATPHFAQNLVGDFGGGSTYLIIGILAALVEARISGLGQVVDAAIVDGTAHLSLSWASMLVGGVATETRGTNLLDGGAPNYRLYETLDHKHMAVGPLEPQFLSELLEILDLDSVPEPHPEWLTQLLEEAFAAKTQAEWAWIFGSTDACVAPVLPLSEAVEHPHLKARGVFVEHGGQVQPAPAPRFSRTQPTLTTGPTHPGENTREALEAWGVEDIEALMESGAAWQR